MSQHFKRIAPFVFVPGCLGVLPRTTIQLEPIHQIDLCFFCCLLLVFMCECVCVFYFYLLLLIIAYSTAHMELAASSTTKTAGPGSCEHWRQRQRQIQSRAAADSADSAGVPAGPSGLEASSDVSREKRANWNARPFSGRCVITWLRRLPRFLPTSFHFCEL